MPASVVGRAGKITGRPRARAMAAIMSRAISDNWAEVVLGFGFCAVFCRSDLGVSLNAGNVSAWGDQSKAAHHPSQGVAASQPAFATNAKNGYPAINCDGVNDFLTVAFTHPQPAFLSLVLKNITIGAPGVNDILTDGGIVFRTNILQNNAPLFWISATLVVSSPTRQADGFYDFLSIQFNTVTSYARAHGVEIASGSAGTNVPAGLTLGAAQSGARPANVSFIQVVDYISVPDVAVVRRLEVMAENRFAL